MSREKGRRHFISQMDRERIAVRHRRAGASVIEITANPAGAEDVITVTRGLPNIR